jgi:hypothetical protein
LKNANGQRENAIRQTNKRGHVDDKMYVRMFWHFSSEMHDKCVACYYLIPSSFIILSSHHMSVWF